MKTVKRWLIAASIPFTLVGCGENAQQEVNVYSYRQPFLIEPMLKAFTEQTGIKVNVKFAKEGIAEKLKQEGKHSPADVLLTVDVARLQELVENDLTQAVSSQEITNTLPAHFRDEKNQWFALTLRTRGVYSSRDRVGKLAEDFDYLDLAKPEYKGKICTRSGKHPYNVSLVSAMIANHGEATTKNWLEGVKANLARKPQGNDRGQVKAISEGLCDISLGNGYYLGKMLAEPEQIAWANAIYYNYPGAKAKGTHVNVSGMAMAKYSPNKDNAVKLMEFLVSEPAQKMYAELNYEDPVNPKVSTAKLVESWGNYRPDSLKLALVAENNKKAVKLLDEVQFDL